MNKRTKGDAVRRDEVLGKTLSQTDNGPSPAEPSAGPPNRKVLRTLALVVLLGIAGVVAWAKWATVSSIFHGGNGSDRIIGLSGRIEGDDSAVASKTSGRILEVRVREGDSVNAGQILAVLDDQQVRAREEQARGAVEGAVARTKAAKAQIEARLVRQGFLYAAGAVGSCLPTSGERGSVQCRSADRRRGRRQTTDRGYEGSVDNCKGECRQCGDPESADRGDPKADRSAAGGDCQRHSERDTGARGARRSPGEPSGFDGHRAIHRNRSDANRRTRRSHTGRNTNRHTARFNEGVSSWVHSRREYRTRQDRAGRSDLSRLATGPAHRRLCPADRSASDFHS